MNPPRACTSKDGNAFQFDVTKASGTFVSMALLLHIVAPSVVPFLSMADFLSLITAMMLHHGEDEKVFDEKLNECSLIDKEMQRRRILVQKMLGQGLARLLQGSPSREDITEAFSFYNQACELKGAMLDTVEMKEAIEVLCSRDVRCLMQLYSEEMPDEPPPTLPSKVGEIYLGISFYGQLILTREDGAPESEAVLELAEESIAPANLHFLFQARQAFGIAVQSECVLGDFVKNDKFLDHPLGEYLWEHRDILNGLRGTIRFLAWMQPQHGRHYSVIVELISLIQTYESVLDLEDLD